jgi:hypothetical protein
MPGLSLAVGKPYIGVDVEVRDAPAEMWPDDIDHSGAEHGVLREAVALPNEIDPRSGSGGVGAVVVDGC